MRLCPLFQLLDSLRGSSTPRRVTWYERHRRSCPHCQARDQELLRLTEALGAAAARGRRPAPPFLVPRILQACRPAGVRPASISSLMGGRLAPVALGALALLGLGLTWWLPRETTPPTVAAVAVNPAFFTPDLPRFLPDAQALLTLSEKFDDPLAREWELVLADTQSAVRTLAAAFLPTTGPGPRAGPTP